MKQFIIPITVNKIYPYRFTCIMPIYKVEEYIHEAINSVLEQDIGFQKYIQLILVNDGNPDSCARICDEYAQKYPNNIKVIHKENGGLSSARNAGLKLAEGEFISFIDPDDKFSTNVLSDVYKYFVTVKDKTDIVSIPVYYFEKKEGPHKLNNKFKSTSQLVNMNTRHETIQYFANSSFYTLEAIQHRKFCTALPMSEDFRLNYELFLEKPYLGLVPSVKYLYRIRNSENISIIQSWKFHSKFYNSRMELNFLYLLNLYYENLGYIPRFVQNAVMHDLNNIIKLNFIPDNVLTDTEETKLHENISNVLELIDDEVILSQPNAFYEYKIHTLILKRGNVLTLDIRKQDIQIYYKDNHIKWLSKIPFTIKKILVDNSRLIIEGRDRSYTFLEQMEQRVVIEIEDKKYSPEILEEKYSAYSLGVPTVKDTYFKLSLDIKRLKTYGRINFIHYYNNNPVYIREVQFGKDTYFYEHNKKQDKPELLLNRHYKLCIDNQNYLAINKIKK